MIESVSPIESEITWDFVVIEKEGILGIYLLLSRYLLEDGLMDGRVYWDLRCVLKKKLPLVTRNEETF